MPVNREACSEDDAGIVSTVCFQDREGKSKVDGVGCGGFLRGPFDADLGSQVNDDVDISGRRPDGVSSRMSAILTVTESGSERDDSASRSTTVTPASGASLRARVLPMDSMPPMISIRDSEKSRICNGRIHKP